MHNRGDCNTDCPYYNCIIEVTAQLTVHSINAYNEKLNDGQDPLLGYILRLQEVFTGAGLILVSSQTNMMWENL